MKIFKLSREYHIKPFDCGDADLNDFLVNDAKDYMEKNLANTFVVEEDNQIIAYYSLMNDKISKLETDKSAWRRLKRIFPHAKHLGSYPAVKIGRLAVSVNFKGRGIGRELLRIMKKKLFLQQADSAFRFLSVDAYLSAIPFYEKNGFKELVSDDDNKHTRLMYFDMMDL